MAASLAPSTVYHLARAGSTYAVLVEQDTLGAGSTGESVPSPVLQRAEHSAYHEGASTQPVGAVICGFEWIASRSQCRDEVPSAANTSLRNPPQTSEGPNTQSISGNTPPTQLRRFRIRDRRGSHSGAEASHAQPARHVPALWAAVRSVGVALARRIPVLGCS